MRLVTFAIAIALLSVGMPAIANNGGVEHEERWHGAITIDDTIHVQAGWWGNSGLNDSQDPGDLADPVWVQISGDGDVNLNVETEGLVIAALDIFELEEDTPPSITPSCPHELVYPLYPDDEGEPVLSYVASLPENAPDTHRVGPNEDSVSVPLTVGEGEPDYLAAIYPQVATGAQDTATVTWNVTRADGEPLDEEEDDVEGGEFSPEADFPYDTDKWIDPLRPNTYFDCVEVPRLPGIVPVPDELPLSGQSSPSADDLMSASLPGPSVGGEEGIESESLESLAIPQGHDPEMNCLHGDNPGGETEQGYIQASAPYGEQATVTEASILLLFPLLSDPGLDASFLAQGLDAWVWNLGCETGPHADESLCIEDVEPPNAEEILTLSVEDFEEPTFGLKFYGETLSDFEGYRSLENGECLEGGAQEENEIPHGAENIVVFVEDGGPQGGYMDFDFQKFPTGTYSSYFCASYGDASC